MPTERSDPDARGILYYRRGGRAPLAAGLYQQINLILLVFDLAAGPFLASIVRQADFHVAAAERVRRVPAYVFSGDPLVIDYTLENGRRWSAALALFMEDSLVPVDRSASGATALLAAVFFAQGRRPRPRAGSLASARARRRGKYRFRDLDVGTRVSVRLDGAPGHDRASDADRGLSQDRPAHPRAGSSCSGRPPRTAWASGTIAPRSKRNITDCAIIGPGDSPRWIHWRTSARAGELMVKEFEQQNEQDLAILIDPWLPRTKVARRAT